MEGSHVYQVSELTETIKQLLDTPVLNSIAVEGEISNFKHHVSGHMYFTLKDAGSRLKCVMFRSRSSRLLFKPANGQTVVAVGSIGVYEVNGEYQLYVDRMLSQGVGALHAAYEKLRQRLEDEGVFSPDRKQTLPFLPKTAAIITSPTGAAVRDVISVLHRRFPPLNILVVPAQVQGEAAALSLVKALELTQKQSDVDVIIIGRGGGSIEELWAFNDETLARAIAKSTIPVVSAVGHETDFTIADWAADVRAPTPSAAAEMIVPDYWQLRDQVDRLRRRLVTTQRQRLQHLRHQQLQWQSRPVLQHPLRVIDQKRQRLDDWWTRLIQKQKADIGHQRLQLHQWSQHRIFADPQKRVTKERDYIALLFHGLEQNYQRNVRYQIQRFSAMVGQLDSLSPLAVLSRGYAVAQNASGVVLRDWQQAPINSIIEVTLHNGQLRCRVEEGMDDGKYDL